MRLWSIHPSYLDQKGLVAVWREGLLAKKVLEGKTKGYKHHPQLVRFKNAPDPLLAINKYLEFIYLEAYQRGYAFDKNKLTILQNATIILQVTSGQLSYEFQHLLKKLKTRDPKRYENLQHISTIIAHPIFSVVEGEIEAWEVVQ